jgi:hypothetical protein
LVVVQCRPRPNDAIERVMKEYDILERERWRERPVEASAFLAV